MRTPKICHGVLHRFQRRQAWIGFKVDLVQEWAGLNSPAASDVHTPDSDAPVVIWKPFLALALLLKVPLWRVRATAGSVPAACEIQR